VRSCQPALAGGRYSSEAQRAASAFLVSVAQGTSGLDLNALRTTRERAWR
jgi:hypothetical protein